jgi:Kef-type K+ transport system membrane component KefB
VHHLLEISLPLVNPVSKFLLILIIILLAPLILNKVKIPPLLGLIISGAVVGPNGLHLMERDSSIILSGTVGLLYIMFLAGLEIDLADFKKNSRKSLVFGMYTFIIPMVLGIWSGIYILGFSMPTSILLASMFASHTLIAYPLISKLGVSKNRAVNIALGGTMITDTLALLVLAIVVGMTTGDVTSEFWITLSLSIVLFALVVIFLFPVIGRWFFKRVEDNVSQYIFVLVMLFLGAAFAEMAGIEAIIGAFLVGLTLNRLIPQTSPLMNRIDFVGNAIFIPFFLIGVGMLIDYRVFFTDSETIKVAIVMIVVATVAKFLAAWLAQKTYRFSVDERRLIFGLSNAQAAATLAAVLVGYNIILGETATGAPIRLLNDSVLNGTILMILFTCTIASFVAQKGAQNIALSEAVDNDSTFKNQEKILIPISNIGMIDELVNLGVTLKSKQNTEGLHALSIIDNNSAEGKGEVKAKKILDKATTAASATDTTLHGLIRYDLSVANGIIGVIKEHKITELLLGLSMRKDGPVASLSHLIDAILKKTNITTLIYKSIQPLSTIKRHVVIVPDKAEKEIGFPFCLIKLWNISRNSGAKLVFYATADTLKFIKAIHSKHPIESDFIEFNDWDDFLVLSRYIQTDDNLIIILSRKDKPSYQQTMSKIPGYLNTYFQNNSFLLIYPMQIGLNELSNGGLNNPTLLDAIETLDEIGKTIIKLFKTK